MRLRTLLIWAVALLVGFAFASQSIRLRAGQAAARAKQAASAVAIRPQNARGQALLAEAYFASGRIAEAERHARAAVRESPLSVIAIRTLALAAERRKGPGAGDPLFRIAGTMGWRDRPTQAWALQRAIAMGDGPVAIARADAMLRSNNDEGLLRIVRILATDPRGRSALIDRLTLRPTWRSPFLNVLSSASNEEMPGVIETLRALRSSKTPPTRDEATSAIAWLLQQKRFADAEKLDRAMVRRSAAMLLDDGGFERAGTDYRTNVTPFDWTIYEVGPVRASLDESGGERSIAVSTDGSEPASAMQRQLRLAPGNYRFYYRTRGSPESPSVLGWNLSCSQTGAAIASSDRRPLSTTGWERRAVPFAVTSQCPFVTLALVAFPGMGPGGDAQFDDVSLVRN